MIVRRIFTALATGALVLLAGPAVAGAAVSDDWHTWAYYEATGSGWRDCQEDGQNYVDLGIAEDHRCTFVQTEENAYIVLSVRR